jgi:hypothetical protein
VKLSLVGGAGFAGLVRTVEVESGDVPELDARVATARVFELPEQLGDGEALPDAPRYAVTVEDSGRRHTVLAAEDAMTPELRALVDWAQSVPGRREHIAPAGQA